MQSSEPENPAQQIRIVKWRRDSVFVVVKGGGWRDVGEPEKRASSPCREAAHTTGTNSRQGE